MQAKLGSMSTAERNSLIKVGWQGVSCPSAGILGKRYDTAGPVERNVPPVLPSSCVGSLPPDRPLPLPPSPQLVINITAAFGSFQRWTVGLGIEHQLQALQAAVGLPPSQVRPRLPPRVCRSSPTELHCFPGAWRSKRRR